MLLALVSLLSIYSAQHVGQYSGNFVLQQAFFYVLGVGVIAVVMRFDSDQLKKLSWYLYGFGIIMLLGLFVFPHCNTCIAPRINGAVSWYNIPFVNFRFQPSEFVKVFLIILLAKLVTDHQQKVKVKTLRTDLRLLGKLTAVTMLPVLIIMKQPDLGTSLVYLSILAAIILVSGITWKLILPIFAGGATIAGSIFYLVLAKPEILEKYLGLHQYQFKRVYSWLDPYNYPMREGFQLIRSLNAIGSGLTTGKGYGVSEVYFPENHTDFIFSTIGEQFGFIGGSIVIGLFFMLIYHITKIALETKNNFYTYICAGIIMMIAFHVFQNIGMTIQLVPITGIPLPFISYGGSSLIGNMLALGLVFSARYHHRKYMFSSDRED